MFFLGAIFFRWICQEQWILGDVGDIITQLEDWQVVSSSKYGYQELYFNESKKSPTGPTERTPKPEYLITLATYLGVRWWGPIQFLMEWRETSAPSHEEKSPNFDVRKHHLVNDRSCGCNWRTILSRFRPWWGWGFLEEKWWKTAGKVSF